MLIVLIFFFPLKDFVFSVLAHGSIFLIGIIEAVEQIRGNENLTLLMIALYLTYRVCVFCTLGNDFTHSLTARAILHWSQTQHWKTLVSSPSTSLDGVKP
jgi:hypothetical protein